MSVLTELADLVALTINGADLSQPVEAVRYYVPVHELEELKTLAVSVVPITLERSLQTRGGRSLTSYGVDCAIQLALPSGPLSPAAMAAVCDPLMTLAEEIATLFFGRPVPGMAGAMCTDVKNVPVFAPEHLDEKRVFTSLLTLTIVCGN